MPYEKKLILNILCQQIKFTDSNIYELKQLFRLTISSLARILKRFSDKTAISTINTSRTKKKAQKFFEKQQRIRHRKRKLRTETIN